MMMMMMMVILGMMTMMRDPSIYSVAKLFLRHSEIEYVHNVYICDNLFCDRYLYFLCSTTCAKDNILLLYNVVQEWKFNLNSNVNISDLILSVQDDKVRFDLPSNTVSRGMQPKAWHFGHRNERDSWAHPKVWTPSFVNAFAPLYGGAGRSATSFCAWGNQVQNSPGLSYLPMFSK